MEKQVSELMGNADFRSVEAVAAKHEIRRQAHIDRVKAALVAPVIMENASASKLVEDLKSGDKTRIESAVEHLKGAIMAPMDELAGVQNPINIRNKSVNSSVMLLQGRAVEVFTNVFGDELESIDMSFMQAFATDQVMGANGTYYTMWDIVQGTEAHHLASPTSPIPASNFQASYWSKIGPEFYGAHVPVARFILETDPLTTLNAIVIAIRVALMKKRSSEGFRFLQAGIDQAITDSQVTAYTASSIARSLNTGYRALIRRNQNKGYGLNNSVPVVMFASEGLRDILEAAFTLLSTMVAAINNNNGVVSVGYPIIRSYNWVLDEDLGDSGSKVALVLPFRKIRQGNFRNQMIESATKIETDSVSTYGREAYAHSVDSEQIEVVNVQ